MTQGPNLLAIFAHPDDESFAAGGTLALAAAHGWNVGLVCFTSGEAYREALPQDAPQRREYAQRRERELERACRVLGIDRTWLLRFPDGGLQALSKESLANDLAALIAEVAPSLIVSFGQDGLNGHPDHVTVGLVTALALQRLTSPPPSCWQVAWPGNPLATLMGAGPPCRGSNDVFSTVNVAAVRRQKLRAIACHRSQLSLKSMAYEAARSFRGREYFRVQGSVSQLAHAHSFLESQSQPFA